MKLKVLNETGLGRGLRYFNADTGEELDFKGAVQSVEWVQDKGAGILRVNFINFELHTTGPIMPTLPSKKPG